MPDHPQVAMDEAIKKNGFMPDWFELWTPAVAEQQLAGFKWKGVGWYITQRGSVVDTMLVTPVCWSEHVFAFHVWNSRDDVGSAFGWVINAPVREDTRTT